MYEAERASQQRAQMQAQLDALAATKGELDSKAAELSAQLGSLPAGEGASAIEALQVAAVCSRHLQPTSRDLSPADKT